MGLGTYVEMRGRLFDPYASPAQLEELGEQVPLAKRGTRLTDLANAAPPGARGVLYLPFIAEGGERAPFVQPAARAGFIGLTSSVDRPVLARAVMEGVALAIRHCHSFLPSAEGTTRLTGGGARSRLWCQMVTDLLGRPVVRIEIDEPGALGVAMAAATELGDLPSLPEAIDRWVGRGETFEPGPSAATYEALYGVYVHGGRAAPLGLGTACRGELARGRAPLMVELRERRLKVGIFLNDDDAASRWTILHALAREAESAGFDSIWVGDHLLFRSDDPSHGPPEAWSMLAALAVSTERVELGPLVSCMSFRNPALLAKTAATVDDISGGRLVLGLGAGWHEDEYAAFGLPFDHRIARFEEAFKIVVALLREGSVDFTGRYFQLRDCEPRPAVARPGGPRLLVGSSGDRMLRITLPYVDAWNAWYTETANEPGRAGLLAARADAVSREVGQQHGALEHSVAVLVQPALDDQPTSPRPRDGVMPIAGSAEEIARRLLAFRTDGIDHLQLVLNPISQPLVAALAPVLELLKEADRSD